MQTFTMSDLINSTDDVTDAADHAAVKLTSDGDTYVILRIETFEDMQRAARTSDPRRVFRTEDLPPQMIDVLFLGVPDVAIADLPIVYGTQPYDPLMSEEDGLRLVAKPDER
jgi:hypothetical protein